ncbi:WD repeat-containing protein 18-like [Oncorhynchus clarkii lewisi]|uniref:WD repeat-containing protein 18-like n=1 Tax=Oncorhynchus clarkii lewisi TaxID=490388 RepID=UPI0039B9B330
MFRTASNNDIDEYADSDQLQQKIVCPGIVTCLTASPNGLYLLAGIAEAIYFWEQPFYLRRQRQPGTGLVSGQLWELSSGEMLLSVLFDVGIMSVTLDPCEYCLFCGGSDGGIFQVSLCSQSLSRDKTFQSDNEGNQVIKGHRKLVTCLSVSMDGTLLLSGSHDETIRLWDIQSNQSIRSINHKGPVTNALIIPAPANMFLPDSRPGIPLPLPRFSRHLNPLVQAEGTETGGVCLCLPPPPHRAASGAVGVLEGMQCAIGDALGRLYHPLESPAVAGGAVACVFVNGENTKVRVSELVEEVRALKKVNKDLYDFSTQLLTKPS